MKTIIEIATGWLIRPKYVGQAIGWAATAALSLLAGLAITLSPEAANAIGGTLIALGQWISDPEAGEPEAVAGIVAVLTPLAMALLSSLTSGRQANEAAGLQAELSPDDDSEHPPLKRDGRLWTVTKRRARFLRRFAANSGVETAVYDDGAGGSGPRAAVLPLLALIALLLPCFLMGCKNAGTAIVGAGAGTAVQGSAAGGPAGAAAAQAGKWLLSKAKFRAEMDNGIAGSATLFGAGPQAGIWWTDSDTPGPLDAGYRPLAERDPLRPETEYPAIAPAGAASVFTADDEPSK